MRQIGKQKEGDAMFRKLVSTTSLLEAGELQSLLTEKGFHPSEVEDSSHVILAGADQVYYVEVPEAEVEAAIEFLESKGFGHRVLR